MGVKDSHNNKVVFDAAGVLIFVGFESGNGKDWEGATKIVVEGVVLILCYIFLGLGAVV